MDRMCTNEVSTTGAAAKVINVSKAWGKKVRPGTFGKMTAGQREYPKSPSAKNHNMVCYCTVKAPS